MPFTNNPAMTATTSIAIGRVVEHDPPVLTAHGRSSVTAALFCLIAACGVAGCSGDPAKLSSDCSKVFAAPAADAEGSCDGSDGKIDVRGTDCNSGPRLMLAERDGGEDYAWARVGDKWTMLTREGTNAAAFRDCTG